MSESFKPFLNQNYKEIKAECLREKKLFKDPKFPACNQSMFKFRKPKIGGIPVGFKWKRPHEFLVASDPKFIVDRINPDDIFQGELGDCWFLSAVSVVVQNKEYCERIIPEDQSFDKHEYCGMFHFRFWHFGEWVDVVIGIYYVYILILLYKKMLI